MSAYLFKVKPKAMSFFENVAIVISFFKFVRKFTDNGIEELIIMPISS